MLIPQERPIQSQRQGEGGRWMYAPSIEKLLETIEIQSNSPGLRAGNDDRNMPLDESSERIDLISAVVRFGLPKQNP
ncbi:MAG: hypothetical protein AAF802_27610 [Planctomycetota bacterium]